MLRRLCLFILLAVASGSAGQVPRRSPEFAIGLNGGKQILLTQHKGKVIALIFILTYCPHCQTTVQHLTKLQNEFGPRGFQALSSAIEDMASLAIPDFLRRFQPNFPVGFNPRDPVVSYLQHPPMLKLLMPQLVLIDREFNIRAQYSGDDPFFGPDQEKHLRARIEGLLAEGKPAAKKISRRKK